MDLLVRAGWYETRTDLLTDAIGTLLDRVERERLDAAIVQGYTTTPPNQIEEDWAAASTRDLLAEERW